METASKVVRNVTLQKHETYLEHNLDKFCFIIFSELAKNEFTDILKIYDTLLFNLTKIGVSFAKFHGVNFYFIDHV